MIGSNGQQTIIHLDGVIHLEIGLYFEFHLDFVEIYSNCPAFYANSLLARWNTTTFNSRIEVETFKVHQIGSISTSSLLNAFCISNNIFSNSSLNLNCQAIVQNVKEIDNSIKVTYQFVPEPTLMKKIEALGNSVNQNYESLIETKVKILFASRRNAKNTFFHRTIRDYELGFSDGHSNFWLGLETLSRVTNKYNYGLRIEVEDKNIVYEEEYESFQIGNSSTQYKLILGKHVNKGTFAVPNASPTWNGNCGCSPYLTAVSEKPNSFLKHNGLSFSTYNYGPYQTVASKLYGGFWHNNNSSYYCFSCQSSVLDNDITTMQFNSYVAGWISSAITRMYLVP